MSRHQSTPDGMLPTPMRRIGARMAWSPIGKEVPSMPGNGAGWPSLDFEAAKLAIDSLHMQTQVVGKVKLALTPAAQHARRRG
jgi:hypothetical protein